MSLLYPVTGCLGKRLRGEEKINHKPSPHCTNCKYSPDGLHKEKCGPNQTIMFASHCSNYEDLSASAYLKKLLKNKRR